MVYHATFPTDYVAFVDGNSVTSPYAVFATSSRHPASALQFSNAFRVTTTPSEADGMNDSCSHRVDRQLPMSCDAAISSYCHLTGDSWVGAARSSNWPRVAVHAHTAGLELD